MPSSVVIFNVTKFRPGEQTMTRASTIFMWQRRTEHDACDMRALTGYAVAVFLPGPRTRASGR